jgi:hypothetical protein
MKWPQGSGPRSVMRSIVGGVIVLALGGGRAAETAGPQQVANPDGMRSRH